MTPNTAQGTHKQAATKDTITHMRNGGSFKNRDAALKMLRVQANIGRQLFGRTLTLGQGLPAMEQDQNERSNLGT